MQQTSLTAYSLMQPKIPKDQDCIIEVLGFNSNLTYHEIADLLRWRNPNKVSRRIPELIRLNKVEISGTKICPIAKSVCSMYKLKNQ